VIPVCVFYELPNHRLQLLEELGLVKRGNAVKQLRCKVRPRVIWAPKSVSHLLNNPAAKLVKRQRPNMFLEQLE